MAPKLIRALPSAPVLRERGDLVVLSHVDECLGAQLADCLRSQDDVWLAGPVDLADAGIWNVAWTNLQLVGTLSSGLWLRSEYDGDTDLSVVEFALEHGYIPDRAPAIEFGFPEEGRMLNAFGQVLLAPEHRYSDRPFRRLRFAEPGDARRPLSRQPSKLERWHP